MPRPGAMAGPNLFRLAFGLLVLDLPLAPEGPGIELGGAPFPPPRCTLRLGTGARQRDWVVLRPPPGAELTTLEWSGQALPPAWSGTTGLLAHAATLAAADQLRLLRFLVETCVPVFRLRQSAPMAALLLRMASDITGRRRAAPMVTPLSRQGTPALSLWNVPGTAAPGAWHLLSGRGVQRIAAPTRGVLMIEARQARQRGMFLLPPPDPTGTGQPPLAFAPPHAGLPGLLETGDAPAAQSRAVARALARRALAEDPLAARLLRDRRLLSRPAEPRRLLDPSRPISGALELALSDTAGGVFIAGWLRDPLGMATGGLALRDLLTGATLPIATEALHRLPRPDLLAAFAKATHGDAGAEPGFLAHLPDAERLCGGPVGQWGLDLRLASGEAIGLVAPPGLLPAARARSLVLRAVPPEGLRALLLDACLTPAVARLQASAMAALGPPEQIGIGAPNLRAHTAIVIPLYRNLRFLRFQIAAFARDRALCRAAQFIFVLDSPEQRAEVEHMLRGLHGVYDVSATLLIMASNAGYASASNAGAAAAGPGVRQILLLNSDVIPAAPGWLAALEVPLRRPEVLATGPKLLFEDESVQHAGLFFARHGAEGDWLNGHYGKGMPRHHPDVLRPRAVPGVTGAALLVRREAFEALGGFCTDYVVGDYEDSDLCLRLRALGGEIRYVPASELYHFERQSITGHAGYAQTLAGAHNRRLHHRRWDGAIEALMARFPGARPASARRSAA